MVRYGLIGAGTMAQEHIRNLALIGGTEVTAFADPDEGMRSCAARLAPDAVGFADHREMISADLCDAYVIAAPNDLHHGILLDVLPGNKAVLCEKPLCTTVDHCREILARAEGRSAPVWVAMEYRYMPPLQRLLHERDAGRIGTPRMFAIREHRFPFLRKVDDWNRFSERTGGTLVEKCCHFWDLMRLVLDSDPVRVFASGAGDVNHLDESYAGRVPDMIDNAYAIVEFENGTRGMLDLCMFAEGTGWQELLTLSGDRGRIEARVPAAAAHTSEVAHRHAEVAISSRETLVEVVEKIEVDETLLDAGAHYGSTFYQHERFLELVRGGGGKPEVSLLDGYWSVLVGEAAEESVRTGQPIDLRGLA